MSYRPLLFSIACYGKSRSEGFPDTISSFLPLRVSPGIPDAYLHPPTTDTSVKQAASTQGEWLPFLDLLSLRTFR